MNRTLLSLLGIGMLGALTDAPTGGSSLFIHLDQPTPQGGGGGAAPPVDGTPPAGTQGGGTPPPAAVPPPVPAPQPVGGLNPVLPPGAQPAPQGQPQPVAPPPVAVQPPAPSPQGGQSQQNANDPNRPLTHADLKLWSEDFTKQIAQMLRPGQGGAAPTPTAANPPAPAPATPPAPPAAQQPADDLAARAAQTKAEEQQRTVNDLKAQMEQLQAEKQRAEQQAEYNKTESMVRNELMGHATYKLGQDSANVAADYMLRAGMVRRDGQGAFWVVIAGAGQNGRDAVYSFSDGITKFLESPQGRVFRAAVMPGSGAQNNYPGAAPMQFPAGEQNPQIITEEEGFDAAVRQQLQQMGQNGAMLSPNRLPGT